MFKQARRSRKKRVDRRSDEQNPFGNEQENPQGGGRSSVAVSIAFLMPVGSGWSLTVITQLDIEAGASQNSSGRQSIGQIANSYNTTARDTTSNCGNTTTTNCNNTTTDNSRAYKNHNELKVIGPVENCSPACSVLRRRGNTLADTGRFCLGNYYTVQPSPAVNTQTREDLEMFGRLEKAVVYLFQ